MNKYIHLKNYLNFMLDNGRDPICPVVYDVMSYVLYLQNLLKTPGAVFSYLSGAKTWVQSVGGDVSSFQSYQVWVMKKGVISNSSHVVSQALAITPQLLMRIVDKLRSLGEYTVPVVTALLISYFTLLRQSNLFVASGVGGNNTHVLSRDDFLCSKSSLQLSVNSTKTCNANVHSFKIILLSVNSTYCPVKNWLLYLNFIRRRGLDNLNRVAFVNIKGLPLSIEVMTRILRKTIRDLNIDDVDKFTLHSLRRGAAQACVEAGLDIQKLRVLGTWKSDSIYKYVPRVICETSGALNHYFA